jgi:hypothetical protein
MSSEDAGGYGFSEMAAETFINTLATHSPEAYKNLEANSYNASLDELLDEGQKRSGLISTYEVELFAKTNNKSVD